MLKKIFVTIVALSVIAFLNASPTYALPPGFKKVQIATGFELSTSFAIAPDGRIFVTQKGGAVRIIKNGATLSTPFLSLQTASEGDQGLIGIALDPNFATNHYVYLHYVNSDPLEIRISRFTASGDTAIAGSEQILLKSNQPAGLIHHGGTLRFGPDGKLWISMGDNGNSANAQNLATMPGKILRINPDGTIPGDNPFSGQTDKNQAIWAYGFRNPFRFNFLANGTPIIGDVGEFTWEEIDIGTFGANYGWPEAEGVCSTCAFVNPIFTYSHSNESRAVVGGFVDSHNIFYYGDYVKGFIRKINLDMQGNFVSEEAFDPEAGTVVDIEPSENDEFYFLTIFPGELYKVTKSYENLAPTAKITADPQGGPTPLTVNFSSDGSTDPEGTALTYKYDFGDGTQSTDPNPTHIFQEKKNYTVTLIVSDGQLTSAPVTTIISAGNHIPTPYIVTPWSASYNAGQEIAYGGFATDAEDYLLPPSAFSWNIIFHHQTHIHPFLGPVNGVNSGKFTIPDTGESSADSFYEIQMTVTDSGGLKKTVSKNIYPNKSKLKLDSLPISGLKITVDGIPQTTPATITSVVGFKRTLDISLPHQTKDGKNYDFLSWSDEKEKAHVITTPSDDTEYTAKFLETPKGSGTVKFRVIEFDADGHKTGNFINGAKAKLTDLSVTSVFHETTSQQTNNEDGWVTFDSIDSGVYSILTYKSGYQGYFKQTSCDDPGTYENVTFNSRLTERFTAAWQSKVVVPPNQITSCYNVGLKRVTKGNIQMRTFLMERNPQDPTETEYRPTEGINDVTVKLTDPQGNMVYKTTKSERSANNEDGMVNINDVEEGLYGLMAYKTSYSGFWRKLSCSGASEQNKYIQNTNTDGLRAAWNNNVKVEGGRTNFCYDLGLLPEQNISPTPACLKNKGDADCNGTTDIADFEIWRKEFTGELVSKNADFNSDEKVNIIDFELWRRAFTAEPATTQ